MQGNGYDTDCLVFYQNIMYDTFIGKNNRRSDSTFLKGMIIGMADTVLTSRQKQAISTKRKIQSAAKLVAQTKGLDHFNVKEICEEAGISVGGFYHHFSSLEFLIEESFKYDSEIEERLKQSPLAGDAYNKLQTLFSYQMEFVERYGVSMMTLLYRSYISDQQRGCDHYMLEQRLMPCTIKSIVVQAQQDGELVLDSSPQDMAAGLLYLTRGIIFSWTLSNASFDIKAVVHRSVHVFLQGKLVTPK